jgi:sugar lactone lactonase YvrE
VRSSILSGGMVLGLLTFALACAPKQQAADKAENKEPAESNARTLAVIGGPGSHIEGIAEHGGKLYVADWKDAAVYRIDPANPAPTRVAVLPVPGVGILGVAADDAGNLYFAVPDSGFVLKVAADRIGASDFSATKDVMKFATGAKGANGLAFDRSGHLWIGGGDSHVLYHVGPKGGKAQVFAKDYSPMNSDTTVGVRPYTVNGVAVDSKGLVYTVNTGTGEVSRLEVKPDYKPGKIESFVKDDRLMGADGVIVDGQDNLWIACNIRNALVKVTQAGEISEIAVNGPGGPMHFPAELKLAGKVIYLANLNMPWGANAGATDSSASVVEVKLP